MRWIPGCDLMSCCDRRDKRQKRARGWCSIKSDTLLAQYGQYGASPGQSWAYVSYANGFSIARCRTGLHC